VTTVALWHLGVTGILAGALSSVILVQFLGDVLRRMRRGAHRTAPVLVPSRLTIEPRTVRVRVRASNDQAPAMASAAGAR